MGQVFSMPTRAVLPALVSLALMAAGCGGAPVPAAPSSEGASADPTRAADLPSSAAEDPRTLGPDATFGDLVAAARALDDAAEGDGSAGCLLRRSGAAHRLEADLAVAVRPLPAAPDDLDTALTATAAGPAVLTRWGHFGASDAPLALVAFSATPPPAEGPIVAVAVTRQGVRLSSTGQAAPPRRVLAADEVATALEAQTDAAMWLITAEAAVPVERLRALFASLPAGAPPVALAVALAPGTRLPDPPDPQAPEAPLCEAGLPPAPASAPEGSMDPAQARHAIAPLRRALEGCATADPRTTGRAARLGIHLRVDEDGRVIDACVTEDSLGSAILRRCVLSAAAELRFPEPQPSGWVDLAFPIHFETDHDPPQRPLCEPGP
jgi:hypothetical protein